MKLLLTLVGTILLLALAAFCLFGFLATFEPTDTTVTYYVFRIAYVVIGLGSLAGIVVLAVRSIHVD